MNTIILVLISRGSVYFFGFIAVILLSVILPKNEFGRLSLIQSAAEITIIFCTAGSALLYTRIGIRRGARYLLAPILKTVLITSPLGALILFLILKDFVSDKEYFLTLIAAIFQAASLLIMSALRGEGSSFLINYESAVRGAVTSFFLTFLFILNYSPELWIVISILLTGNVLILFLSWHFCIFNSKITKTKITSKALISLKYFGFSLIQFLTRKFDIILVSYLFGFAHAAEYKIAFLFSESILQFSQAYINTKITTITDTKSGIELKAKIFKQTLILALFCLGASLAMHAIYAAHSNKPLLNQTLITLSVYFTFRAGLSFHENLLAIKLTARELLARSLKELIVRSAIIYTACILFRLDYIYIFLPIAIFELYLYHFSMKERYDLEKIVNIGMRI